MKAAIINQTGPPESIRYNDLDLPEIGARQVLVRTSCVTVNWVDTYIRSGSYPTEFPIPYIIGRDMVGVVEEVGSKVRSFRVGDRVWARTINAHLLGMKARIDAALRASGGLRTARP